MRKNNELQEKRRELKKYINDNIGNTPMALILCFPEVLLRKLTGSAIQLTITGNAIVLGLLVTIPTFLAVFALHDSNKLKLEEWLGMLIVLEGFCFSTYMAYFNVNRLLRQISDFVVDSMISISDLSDLRQWLSLGWTPRILKYYLFGWIVCLTPIATLNMFIAFGRQQVFSLYVWIITFLILSGMSWSYAPLNMILSFRLSRYAYLLHEIDPARSEIIGRISSGLNIYAYGYALNAAVVQLIFAAVGRFYLFGITAAFVAWIPLTIQFVLNQLSMRRIIVNAKWKTLHSVQSQIKELHSGDIKDKNNLEVILRLMDYHDRIQATPNSILDLSALLNLSNQLAIPSLGFLLANIEKIVEFFQ